MPRLLPGKGKLCVTSRCVWFPLEVAVPQNRLVFAGSFLCIPAFDSFFLCCVWSERDSLMSLGKRCLQLFHDPVRGNNIDFLVNIHEILFLFYMKKKSAVKLFKGIAPGFKIRALVNMEDTVNTTSKHLGHFWGREITVARKTCIPYINASSVQRARSYIAETSKCNLNYASSYQLYIEYSPGREQSSKSCDSYDCIKLHTLVAFCQPKWDWKMERIGSFKNANWVLNPSLLYVARCGTG